MRFTDALVTSQRLYASTSTQYMHKLHTKPDTCDQDAPSATGQVTTFNRQKARHRTGNLLWLPLLLLHEQRRQPGCQITPQALAVDIDQQAA